MNERAAQRFKADGPKRILSIDGGGVRGIVAIAFLERIEAVLREQHGNDKLVLSDYFDLIGGTSVGSMIATQLAMGADVATVRGRFEAAAPKIFLKTENPLRNGINRARYPASTLTRVIKDIVQEETMASSELKTGLCIVMKRMNTGSIWPLTNNPYHPYWEPRPSKSGGGERTGIRDYKIWHLVRSSCAAPTYFSPHRIDLFEGPADGPHVGWFVDGAISPFNNPALLLFMMAGMKGYNFGGGPLDNRFSWHLGADNLQLISVGTGSFAFKHSPKKGRTALDAVHVMRGLIQDGSDLGLALLQWMSRSTNPWVLDRVVGDLRGETLHTAVRDPVAFLKFERYDMVIDADHPNPSRDSRARPGELTKLQALDNPNNMTRLYRLAQKAAEDQVSKNTFALILREGGGSTT